MSDRERDNELRFRADRAERGHVESHFLKATAPDGLRAIWARHTLFSPRGAPERATAQVWGIAFDRRDPKNKRTLGAKRVVPVSEARFSAAPFSSEFGGGRFDSTSARGEADRVKWDLRWAPRAMPFHLYPLERMYTGGFPSQKQLSPTPDALFTGWVDVDGERWIVDGWPGMQGHNWGRGNTHAYVWGQCNSWIDGPPGTWFEGAGGRIKLGPTMSPWVTFATLCANGELHRFDRVRAALSRKVEVGLYLWRFTLKQGAMTLDGEVSAEREDLAGLVYDNPAGSPTYCLNSKLATGTLVLRRSGRIVVELKSNSFALELGTKDETHGVPILA